jgi:hypothetical protein
MNFLVFKVKKPTAAATKKLATNDCGLGTITLGK